MKQATFSPLALSESTIIEKIEKHIQASLLKGETPKKIATSLLKRKTILNNNQAFLNVCRFMYQAGLYKMILKVSLNGMNQKTIIPWGFLIATLNDYKINIPKKVKSAFLKGIDSQKQIKAVLSNNSWDVTFPSFKAKKEKVIDKINKIRNPDFIKLIEDLEFIQRQGVFKKEKEILIQLQKIEPQNPKVQEQWLQFKEKWGRHLIQKKKQELLKKQLPIEPPSVKEQKQVKRIFQAAMKLVKKKPSMAYDLALLFSFIGYPRKAVNILEKNLHSTVTQWLYADLLLQSKLYVSVLSFTDYMEAQHKKDPHVVFALAYLRARAYWYLGKRQKAKNILTELQKIKPNYRLIHVLLEQWKKEDEH